mgnify:CR=1 FL=1
MSFLTDYIKEVYGAVRSLLIGMRRTGYYFTHHKEIITQNYPENRETLGLPERFRGEVVMTHNETNEHRCTGCTACEKRCPTKAISGEPKLAFFIEPALCIDCGACVPACPVEAIFALEDTPDQWTAFIGRNRDYFESPER